MIIEYGNHLWQMIWHALSLPLTKLCPQTGKYGLYLQNPSKSFSFENEFKGYFLRWLVHNPFGRWRSTVFIQYAVYKSGNGFYHLLIFRVYKLAMSQQDI